LLGFGTRHVQRMLKLTELAPKFWRRWRRMKSPPNTARHWRSKAIRNARWKC
jgi:hypothetical protein